MCTYQKTTTSRPFLATKVSEVEASSPLPTCSFIPVVIRSRITPIPKISLAMRPSRTTALPVALTKDLDHFNELSSHFYDDEVPTNDDHCFMAPKDVVGQRSALDSTNDDYCFMTPKVVVDQRSALDSPPPLRRPSRYTSTTPPTSLPIPKRLAFPEI